MSLNLRRRTPSHVQLAAPVPPQKFAKPPKFFISEVIDRSGNPQPMLVLKDRGGMFLDRLPTQITREAVEQSLKAADLLAADAASADLVLQITCSISDLRRARASTFSERSNFRRWSRPQNRGVAADPGGGTSIAECGDAEKNVQKNVQANVEGALEDAVRIFCGGRNCAKRCDAHEK